MSATPMSFEFTEDDISSSGGPGGASYAALEPGPYEATLVKVEDYDNRAKGKSHGWIWTYKVEGLDFKDWTAFSQKARWKVEQVLHAFGVDVEAGIPVDVDPNAFVGMPVGVEIDWDKDPDTVPAEEPNYKSIKRVFRLPSEEPPQL